MLGSLCDMINRTGCDRYRRSCTSRKTMNPSTGDMLLVGERHLRRMAFSLSVIPSCSSNGSSALMHVGMKWQRTMQRGAKQSTSEL